MMDHMVGEVHDLKNEDNAIMMTIMVMIMMMMILEEKWVGGNEDSACTVTCSPDCSLESS